MYIHFNFHAPFTCAKISARKVSRASFCVVCQSARCCITFPMPKSYGQDGRLKVENFHFRFTATDQDFHSFQQRQTHGGAGVGASVSVSAGSRSRQL